MFKLEQYNSKKPLPAHDYVFEKVSNFYSVLENLTPRIEGMWEIILLQPSITDAKKLLGSTNIPTWMNIQIYMSKQNLEVVCEEYPDYAPSKVTFKDQVKVLVSEMQNLINKDAISILTKAYYGNIGELRDVLTELDQSATGTITMSDVQKKINYVKPVYASEVLNAFLLQQKNRWKLFSKLVEELGLSFAYNSLYKYAKTLLNEKNIFLKNGDVKVFIVQKIDATFLCYIYSLFSTSTNYLQLYGVMQAIDDRCVEHLERTSYDYLY